MAAPTSASTLFYQSMVNAIGTASGSCYLNLNAGTYRCTLDVVDLDWVIQDGCIATIRFSYSSGVFVEPTSITFDPPIQILVPKGDGNIQLKQALYNILGDAVNSSFIPIKPVSPDVMNKVIKSASISRRSKDLFLGSIFSGLSLVDPSAIVARVRFEQTDTAPGLAITLRDQSVIRFSDQAVGGANSYTNFIIVRGDRGDNPGPSRITFESIDYTPDDRQLSGALTEFSVMVERGLLMTSQAILQLASGSTLAFNHVDLTRSAAGDVKIDANFGILSATIDKDSRVTLDNARPRSELLFAESSKINVQGFRLTITQDFTKLELGGGSSVALKLSRGTLSLGKLGFLNVGASTLNGLIEGVWDSRATANVTLKVLASAFTQIAGRLDLDSDTSLGLASGTITSSDLTFQSGKGLLGTFDKFVFDLAEDSEFGIPDGIHITAGANAHLSCTPLTFSPDAAYPKGNFTVDMPFKKLLNSRRPSFSMSDGRAALSFVGSDDGSYTGSNGSIVGTATITNGNTNANANVALSNISFSKPATGDFNLTAKLKTTISAGISLSFPTQWVKGIPDHDNFRAFPLNIIAAISSPIQIPEANVAITNNLVNMDPVSVSPRFSVTIPPGNGEHSDSDDPNSANGGGPDEDQHLQEAITDTMSLMRIHIYLRTATYPFQANVVISIVNNQIAADISKFRIVDGQNIGYNEDGFDTGVLGSILGAIGGLLTFGAVGLSLGAIVGYVAGEDFQAALNSYIAGVIAKFLLDAKTSWHTTL